jgi:hypothetical protein
MTKSGHLDIVLSNDAPDPKLVLVNDGTGRFRVGGTYGDLKWSTRNAAVGDLNGDGYPDIAVANRGMTSYLLLQRRKAALQLQPTARFTQRREYSDRRHGPRRLKRCDIPLP